MALLDFIKNNFLYGDKYKTHSEAIIISCYFNPQCNPYRLKTFNTFYDSIKHLNHQIVECVIGDSKPQLPINKNITRVYTQNLLWHKESLLNKLIKNLDPKYKYVFWIDADVIFTNKNWLVESVEELRFKNIVQPFEYCVHLDRDEEIEKYKGYSTSQLFKHPRIWRSFCANYTTNRFAANSNIYDVHGHVGFAWGAKREILDICPLYDRALVGGADHIMAHAAAGQIPCECITKSFTDDINSINDWSRKFFSIVGGSIGYAKGDLFHMWHGDLKNRQYLKRVQEFTGTSKTIIARDSNGLHVTNDDSYVRNYFNERENVDNNNFLTSMAVGYITDDGLIGGLVGGNMIGGMLGESLNDLNENNPNQNTNNENFS